MATYGRRRKGPLSAFNVFRDEDKEEDTQHKDSKQPSSTRYSKTTICTNADRPEENVFKLKSKTKQTPLQRHHQSSDESIDELAGEALLGVIPKRTATAASLRSELIADEGTRPSSNRSFHTANENPEKPPSSIPPEKGNDNKSRAVLAQKTANMKVKPTRNDGRIDKTMISQPILQSSTRPEMTGPSRPTTSQSAKTMPLTRSTTTDPIQLNLKISDLMKQAAEQEAESNEKASLLAHELAKPSPRQRAKQAIIKASQVVKGKLKTVNNVPKTSSPDTSATSYTLSLSLEEDSLSERVGTGTLSRRMAEGVNLSNPKIQSLVGSPRVPRKPLPIYESMKSRIQRSSPIEDPFTDDKDSGKVSPVRTEQAAKRKDSGLKQSQSVESIGPVLDCPGPSQNHDRHVVGADPSKGGPKFSSEISGLAQHPDTLYFSSSPDDTSTPLMRGGDRSSGPWKSRNMVPAPSQSKGEISGLGSDDEKSVTPSTASKTVTEGSQSVKRKSAQENLRLVNAPVAKKARTSDPASPNVAAKLVLGMDSLDTQDEERSPLASRVTKAKKQRPHQAHKRKGLAIFDVGKGKAAESKTEEVLVMKRPKLKDQSSRRASFTRPHSMLFSRDPKSEDKRKFAKLNDGDEMEIDELAL